MAAGREKMELVVCRCGNSLALRLPADSARHIGVGEGDRLIAELSPDGKLILSAEGRAIDKAGVRRLRQFIGRQKETEPVVGDLRRAARY